MRQGKKYQSIYFNAIQYIVQYANFHAHLVPPRLSERGEG